LELDDRFGACQPQRQTGIVSPEKRQLGGERVGFSGLRSALGRRQRTEGTGLALPAPVGQGRGVDTLATQDGADAAGLSGAIGIGKDAQLVLRGEAPATRTRGQFG
jgi:hypothetical protein